MESLKIIIYFPPDPKLMLSTWASMQYNDTSPIPSETLIWALFFII